MKRYLLVAKMLVILLAASIIIGCTLYKVGIGPVSGSSENIEFAVSSGDTWYSLGSKLKDAGLIKSPAIYKLYVRMSNPGQVKAGNYGLTPSMGVEKIVNALAGGSSYKGEISITFPEGKNMRAIAKLISDNTNNSYDSVFDTLSDTGYINDLINNYWFLTDDIKNNNIYYSLEGYLFPDTYSFSKNSTVKDIFKAMLDETSLKLEPYKDKIDNSSYSIHQLFTLASIVELEASNASERNDVAGVFYNRIQNGWSLGSDVTAYYAYKMDDWSQGLSVAQINGCNLYNTRGTCFKGLPIGPVCNPGIESIEAVLNPTKTSSFYFVADCSGKTYLSNTQEEHDKIVNDLKSNGNWCDN